MLFDLNPNPMWVFDRKTLQFLAVNAAAVSRYGYSHDEFTRMTIRDIRPPQDVEALEQAVQTEFEARQDASNWRHITRDGTVFDVEIRGRPVTFLGVDAELVLVTDVTERNRLEARLRQSQKMEAVGRLAGGIAHDFNNILSAVLGYSNLVLEDLPDDDAHRADIEEVRDAGMRGAALTRQLLMFSRPQVAERQVLDINEIIAGVRKMLERIIGEDIVIETRLSPDVGRVRMDPGHLEQIVMNLAVNARDAMPDGGRLTIETSEVELDELHHRGNKLLPAGRYVMLAVSDVGVGIPKDQQARIFEPFYTTKPAGEGTGLGLSTVYGIVQQNGGSVLVYSEPGHGATFKVYLPRVEAVATTAEPAPAAPARGHARESILFVEDEPSLLKVGCQILTRAGYTVIGMPGPAEAIAFAAEHPGKIDLVATDMVMPGLSGREMVGRIRLKRPEVRVLFMSGYTDDAIMQRGVSEPGTAFLQKPFSGEGLARKVRAVLDGDIHG
jgi:PAS domain S-box-containing protein